MRCCVVQIDCRSVSSEAFVRLAFPVLRDCFLKIVIVKPPKENKKGGGGARSCYGLGISRVATLSLTHSRDQGVNEAAAKKSQ